MALAARVTADSDQGSDSQDYKVDKVLNYQSSVNLDPTLSLYFPVARIPDSMLTPELLFLRSVTHIHLEHHLVTPSPS